MPYATYEDWLKRFLLDDYLSRVAFDEYPVKVGGAIALVVADVEAGTSSHTCPPLPPPPTRQNHNPGRRSGLGPQWVQNTLMRP